MLRECETSGERAAVFFIDVDRFKTVNDIGGHAAGDTVLRAIAHRLRRTIGEQDAIACFSADEFVVLAVGLDDPNRAESLAAALLATFALPFTYGAHEFHLTASIGASVGPDDADQAERLIAHAEAASFDAKRMGRNVVRRYVPAMLATPSERHKLHRELLHAIERDQLELLYQPIYDVLTGGIRRSAWVISRVCEQIRAWVDAGLDDVRVSLNVSARQLDRLALHRFIGDAIRVNGIEPARLEIEVTETSILRDVYGATLLLRELRGDAVQGYLFSMPVPADECATLFRQKIA